MTRKKTTNRRSKYLRSDPPTGPVLIAIQLGRSKGCPYCTPGWNALQKATDNCAGRVRAIHVEYDKVAGFDWADEILGQIGLQGWPQTGVWPASRVKFDKDGNPVVEGAPVWSGFWASAEKLTSVLRDLAEKSI